MKNDWESKLLLQTVLGKLIRRPAKLDRQLARDLKALAYRDDPYDTVIGKTMCSNDFYEGQGRLDGAFCEFTETDKMEYLTKLQKAGVVNIEMESLCFAALTHHAGIQSAVVCVTLLDRLKGDQVYECRPAIYKYHTYMVCDTTVYYCLLLLDNIADLIVFACPTGSSAQGGVGRVAIAATDIGRPIHYYVSPAEGPSLSGRTRLHVRQESAPFQTSAAGIWKLWLSRETIICDVGFASIGIGQFNQFLSTHLFISVCKQFICQICTILDIFIIRKEKVFQSISRPRKRHFT